MYRLAVIPKVEKKVEYSKAFGSQHDFDHLKKILDVICYKADIITTIIYEQQFYKSVDKFDGVIFLGLSSAGINFISSDNRIDIYVWAFNQCVINETPQVYNNTSIIFEQSTLDLSIKLQCDASFYNLPLAFQHDRFRLHNVIPKFDIVFNGTLYRNRRKPTNTYRVDILERLLQKDLSIINYNGRSKKDDEKVLLEKLKCYPNFKVVNKFGECKEYHLGKYSLDLPFLDTETDNNISIKYGLSLPDLENGIWLNHWDIFRAIGARANIITYNHNAIKKLGLTSHNAHFYKNNTYNLDGMANEIYNIVKSNAIYSIDYKTWHANTYLSRWDFIIKKILNKII